MTSGPLETLPRREREVFETLCRLGSATTASLRSALSDPLSDSATRTLLVRLEAKGLVARSSETGGIVYAPVPRTDSVAAGALRRMVDTFFAGMPHELPPGEASIPFEWSTGMEDFLWGLPGQPSTPPDALDVYGIFPHMHELGTSMSAAFEGPAGSRCAAEIPRWDFEWQTVYFYREPLRFTSEDTLHVACEFDTRTRTEPTFAGFETKDEMCSFGLFVAVPDA